MSIKTDMASHNFEDALIRVRNWVLSKWISLKTVASRYFAMKTLYRIAPEEIVNLGVQETLGFLEDRKSLDQTGFYDYRLQDKMDEAMTTASVTELDKISPHIFSTYYAITMERLLETYARTKPNIDDQAVKSLARLASNPDNGFGMNVMIKDFEQPFGPSSTELETLLVLLFPKLLS